MQILFSVKHDLIDDTLLLDNSSMRRQPHSSESGQYIVNKSTHTEIKQPFTFALNPCSEYFCSVQF